MRSSIAIVLAVASLSCSSVTVPPSTDELLAAPTTVAIDGQDVVLETYMWRDFAPTIGCGQECVNGKPLIAIFRPVRADNGATPPGVRIDEAWVTFGSETWNPAITEEHLADPPAQLFYEAVARNGPKWGPGVSVTVVVRIDDRLLRATNQPISRTD